MDFKNVLISTIMGSIFGLIVAMLILPALVTNLSTTLNSLDLVGTANLVGWLGEICIFFVLAIVSIMLMKYYDRKALIYTLIESFVFGVVFLCFTSFWAVYFTYPHLFYGMTFGDKIFKWYSYPSIVSIKMGSPQLIWVFATIFHLILFNLKFYQLNYGK